MSTPVELSSAEQQAYETITTADELHQSELWKRLDVSSRKGSRLAKSLADYGLIERAQSTHNGRTTYLLTPSEDEETAVTTGTLNPPQTDTVETEGNLTPRQQQALDLIRETKGLYQSELWKELDVSSRTGTRIATALEEKEMIEREAAVHNGHTTYLLRPRTQDLDFSLLMAGDLFVPFVGEEQVDPQSDAFTDWLLQLAAESQ
jgi:DNA-binding MarR family transcriptional regulator